MFIVMSDESLDKRKEHLEEIKEVTLEQEQSNNPIKDTASSTPVTPTKRKNNKTPRGWLYLFL